VTNDRQPTSLRGAIPVGGWLFVFQRANPAQIQRQRQESKSTLAVNAQPPRDRPTVRACHAPVERMARTSYCHS
jgi:hypothetical protein